MALFFYTYNMKVFTLQELQIIAVTILDNFRDFDPYMYAYFNTMFLTGARFGDVYDYSRWSVVDSERISLMPQKGNNLRTFFNIDIDAYLLNSIQNNYDFSNMISYSNSLIWFKRFSPEPNLMVKNKPVLTHLFRHIKAKELSANGYTDGQIKTYFGQSKIASTQAYIYSQVYTP